MSMRYIALSALFTAILNGAGNGVRTRDTKLGKLVLYQLSYARFLYTCMFFIYIIKTKNCKMEGKQLKEKDIDILIFF